MKRRSFLVGIALVIVALTAPRALANSLANPGFEQPVTTDGPPFVGFWEAFNGGAGTLSANSNNVPRSGVGHLILAINNTDNTFAGVFQDVPNLRPGTPVVFSGWNMTTTRPLGLAPEIRIEWRNSTSGSEVARTANLNPAPGDQYTPFTLSATVPAGADVARVVYAIQSFGPEPTNNGTVFVDDVSFVPEPATPLLFGLAGLVLTLRRRRPR
jgi:hypothetical protein